MQQVVELAKALRVSADAILGPMNGAAREELPTERRLLRRLRQIEQLPRAERQALLKTMDAFLKSSQVASAEVDYVIRRVLFKNFRGLADIGVTLQPLTVLVGKNDSGRAASSMRSTRS